jgi:hypothetical protein
MARCLGVGGSWLRKVATCTANVSCWHIASFHFAAEFGRYRSIADIDKDAPPGLGLSVRGLMLSGLRPCGRKSACAICPTGKSLTSLSSPVRKNIPLHRGPKSLLKLPTSRPTQRGVSRSSRTLERDAVDADGAKDEGAGCGRRSRVVLMPRRWHQVGESLFANDGGKKARSPGRARSKP